MSIEKNHSDAVTASNEIARLMSSHEQRARQAAMEDLIKEVRGGSQQAGRGVIETATGATRVAVGIFRVATSSFRELARAVREGAKLGVSETPMRDSLKQPKQNR